MLHTIRQFTAFVGRKKLALLRFGCSLFLASCFGLLAVGPSAATPGTLAWSAYYKVDKLEPVGANFVWIKLKTTAGQPVSIDCPDGGLNGTNFVMSPLSGHVTQEGYEAMYSALLSAAHTGAEIKFRAALLNNGTLCRVERLEVQY